MSEPSGATPPAAASVFAVELLAEFVRRGARDVVVCPGSRSQALALAAAAAEQAGAIALHVRLDERSAAFFALGVARETGIPAPVIVTSGTAVANLLPAALEAHEGRVPFIALAADRPDELRGIRSNQTTRQAHLFGTAARLSLDVPAPAWADDGDLVRDEERDPASLAIRALAAATGFAGEAPPGPVQLNLAFREPLSGTLGFEEMIEAGFVAAGEEAAELRESGARTLTDPRVQATPEGLRTRPVFAAEETYEHGPEVSVPTVVIAGAGAGEEAAEFAHAAGLPLLAEAVSGARYGREAVTCYSTLLDGRRPDPRRLAERIERAIVFGHPTLTRQVPALLKRPDVETIVVDPFDGVSAGDAGDRAVDGAVNGRVADGSAGAVDHYDPGRDARVVRAVRIAAEHDPRLASGWLREWLDADRELRGEDPARGSQDPMRESEEPARESTVRARESEDPARASAVRARESADPGNILTRETLVRLVWSATAAEDRLVLAASRLVRVLDGIAPERRVRVHANRGLGGIDGTLATALGVAAASQDSGARTNAAAGITRLLIGDLATLHDASSLLLPEGEPRPRIQVIVGNDGGGTIFDGLEVAGSAPSEAYDRVMYTPQRVDLAALAAAYGWEHCRAETREALAALLADATTGPILIEAPLER